MAPDRVEDFETFLREAACPVCGVLLYGPEAAQANVGKHLFAECKDHGWFEIVGRETPDGWEFGLALSPGGPSAVSRD